MKPPRRLTSFEELKHDSMSLWVPNISKSRMMEITQDSELIDIPRVVRIVDFYYRYHVLRCILDKLEDIPSLLTTDLQTILNSRLLVSHLIFPPSSLTFLPAHIGLFGLQDYINSKTVLGRFEFTRLHSCKETRDCPVFNMCSGCRKNDRNSYRKRRIF